MADEDRDNAGLPKSPSGRVPQWVRDEAAGITGGPVPFRAAPSTHTGFDAPTPRKRRELRGPLAIAVVIAVAAGSWGVNNLWTRQQAIQIASTGGTNPYAPPPGLGEGPRPAGRPVGGQLESPTSGFRFFSHQSDRVTPVTWSPCRAIHYVVRPDNAPPGGAQDLAQAISQVSAATGLTFVNDGATTEVPTADRPAYQPNVYGKHWAPVLIAWATPQEVPDFGIDVLGEAGPDGYYNPSHQAVYVSGTVYLDSVKLGVYARTGRQGEVLATILHELGHLVGLGHVDDQSDIMYPQVSLTLRRYGPGDLAGLRSLGEGPCQPDV